MGISEGSERGAGIECSVGTIVWVRRRNGSWWPGRVLGPDELSESHLMSPRSGTPVKLLGREDASVDWYNLEKSKRVKAFRCGEFDDCIERAESAQGVPAKKREKYARREDAILHALELERLYLEKKQQKLGIGPYCMTDRMSDISNKVLGMCSPSKNVLGSDKARDHCRFINIKSQTLSKKPDSFEVASMANLLYVPKGTHAKAGWEDDSSEGIPRMRGLQDLGLRIAPSKRKPSAPIACRTSRESAFVDNHVYGNNVSSIKNSMSIKRNRSGGSMPEDSLARRRDRRRPIVKVLQSSAKLPVCGPLQSDGDAVSITLRGKREQGLGSCSHQMQMSPAHFEMSSSLIRDSSLTEDYTSSGLIEAHESDSFEEDYLDPDTEEDGALNSDPTNLGRYIGCGGVVYQVPVQAGNVDNEHLGKSELSSYAYWHHHDVQTTGISDMGGSKWQLKGKRNIRNLVKRPMELVDGRDSVFLDNKCNGAIHESLCEGKGYAYDEGDLIENDLAQTGILGFGNRKYPSMLKAASRERGINNSNFISSDEDSLVSASMWEADRLSQAPLKGYWEETDGCFNYTCNFSDRMESMLIDVDLKVQASYQGEHVPLVSLMSRLDGKAIIGHPVPVETVEDGSSGLLLYRDDFCEDLPNNDENTALPPVWRTARRTTMHRGPRPLPSTALEGEEASILHYSDLESKRPLKQPYAGHIKNKKVVKGTSCHNHRPLAQKLFSKKLLKKGSSSSFKTRTLSSMAVEQRCSGKTSDSKQADKKVELYNLIEPEGTVPLMTCVPVKLAFSRIWEAIGRPPSIPANDRVLIAGNAEGKPM